MHKKISSPKPRSQLQPQWIIITLLTSWVAFRCVLHLTLAIAPPTNRGHAPLLPIAVLGSRLDPPHPAGSRPRCGTGRPLVAAMWLRISCPTLDILYIQLEPEKRESDADCKRYSWSSERPSFLSL